MTSGTPIEPVDLTLDADGRGTLTVRVNDRPALMAVVSHLDEGGVLLGLNGGARLLSIDGEVHEPTEYPARVALPVVQGELPTDAVQSRMSFGNNFLQDSCWVNVVHLDPPAEDGSRCGLLRAHSDSVDEYRNLRRFTEEPHGSALKSLEGPMWFVQQVADDGDEQQPFPQIVNFVLRSRHDG